MKIKNLLYLKKAQSALEYIILVGSLLAVLILFLSPQGNMRQAIDRHIDEAVDQISTMAQTTDFSETDQ